MEKKDFIIFNQHLAGWLMMEGYVLKKLKLSNKKDTKRNVFIFNDTEQLHSSIVKYKELYMK